MEHEKAIAIIRKEFSHVDVEKIVVEYDAVVDCQVAKVFVRSDQLDAAYGKNGIHGRNAAMHSGLSVEIEVSDSNPKPEKRRTGRGGDTVGSFILRRFCGDEEYAIKPV